MSRRRLVNLLLSFLLLTPIVLPICLQSGITRAADGKEKKKKRQAQAKRKGTVRRGTQRRRRGSSRRRGGQVRDKKKEDRYHVVRVNDTADVVKSSKLKSHKSEALKKYQHEVKTYRQAWQRAQRTGESFDKPKPKLQYKVLTTSGYTTEKAAKAFRDRVQKALRKGKEPAGQDTKSRKKGKKSSKKGTQKRTQKRKKKT